MLVPGKSSDTAGPAYSGYILGLLHALESDPQRLSRSLGAGGSPGAPISGDATALPPQQTPENQAILDSVARIADKLVKAQQETGSQHYATPTPTPPAVNNEAASRLLGRNTQGSSIGNPGDSLAAANNSNGTLSSPRSAVSNTSSAYPDHSSDGLDGQPLSAEKELRLLKAQVQDFARVCKVSSSYALHTQAL